MTSKEAFALFLEETKREYDKYCDIIMRDLEALRIINEKDVDITAIKYCYGPNEVEKYNCKENGLINLTEEEYKLLKTVLKNND